MKETDRQTDRRELWEDTYRNKEGHRQERSSLVWFAGKAGGGGSRMGKMVEVEEVSSTSEWSESGKRLSLPRQLFGPFERGT